MPMRIMPPPRGLVCTRLCLCERWWRQFGLFFSFVMACHFPSSFQLWPVPYLSRTVLNLPLSAIWQPTFLRVFEFLTDWFKIMSFMKLLTSGLIVRYKALQDVYHIKWWPFTVIGLKRNIINSASSCTESTDETMCPPRAKPSQRNRREGSYGVARNFGRGFEWRARLHARTAVDGENGLCWFSDKWYSSPISCLSEISLFRQRWYIRPFSDTVAIENAQVGI